MKAFIKKLAIGGAVAGAIGAGIMAYIVHHHISKMGTNTPTWPDEIRKDILTLAEILAFFEALNLDRDMHAPILISDNSEYFNDYIGVRKSGYRAMALCVYNIQDEEIEPHKVIYCRAFDAPLKAKITPDGLIRL